MVDQVLYSEAAPKEDATPKAAGMRKYESIENLLLPVPVASCSVSKGLSGNDNQEKDDQGNSQNSKIPQIDRYLKKPSLRRDFSMTADLGNELFVNPLLQTGDEVGIGLDEVKICFQADLWSFGLLGIWALFSIKGIEDLVERSVEDKRKYLTETIIPLLNDSERRFLECCTGTNKIDPSFASIKNLSIFLGR